MLILDGVQNHDQVALLEAPVGHVALHIAPDGRVEFALDAMQPLQLNFDQARNLLGDLARHKAVALFQPLQEVQQGSFIMVGELG